MLKNFQKIRQTTLVSSTTKEIFTKENNPKTSSRLIAITVAKSGTHLLYKALEGFGISLAYEVPYAYHQGIQLLDGSEGSIEDSKLWSLYQEVRESLAALQPGGNKFSQGHLPFNKINVNLLASFGYSKLVMLRDPRAIAVSFMFHVLNTEHPLKPFFLSLPDNDARLLASIQGVTPSQTGQEEIFLKDVGQRFRVIANWLQQPNTYEIRFEHLIGPQGSGSKAVQITALAELARFLNIRVSSRQLEAIAGRVFDTTSETFRAGQIDGWRKHFKPYHIEALKKSANDVLLEFGYEAHSNWSLSRR